MSDVVNLRQFRKRKQREDAEVTAERNRAKFGRTAQERKSTNRERDERAARIDAHFRERSDD